MNFRSVNVLGAGPSGRGRSPAEIVGSNPTGGMDVCCECCVLSGTGLCNELITSPGCPTDCGASLYMI